MTATVPAARPKMSYDDAVRLLAAFDLGQYPVKILGIRGYYKSMANPCQNDCGLYDDAIFVVYPGGFSAFNANTDPSVLKPGVAVLKSNKFYLYKIGMHNMEHPYEALRQYGRVTVTRDGKEETDTAANPFYIDIHKGGINTTSSLGCQTIPPAQWPSFLATVKDRIARHNQVIIPYALIDA